MSSDERWWPEGQFESRSLWLQYLIVDLLGPHLNHDLANFISDAEKMGLKPSLEITALRNAMVEADGRSPKMLALLVSAAVVASEFGRSLPNDDEGDHDDWGYSAVKRVAIELSGDAGKFVGDAAMDAARRYGFTWETWPGFARSASPGREPEWPPRGVAYRRHP